MRENDAEGDNDTVMRQAKRFKNEELDRDKVRTVQQSMPQESYSLQVVERPSSGLSSIASAHHLQPNPEVQGHGQLQRFVHDQQGHFEPGFPPSFVRDRDQKDHFEHSFPSSNGMQSEHPNNASSDMRGLDRFLGSGSNDYLDQHIEKYEESVRKWSECSLEEWKAGAESRFSLVWLISRLT